MYKYIVLTTIVYLDGRAVNIFNFTIRMGRAGSWDSEIASTQLIEWRRSVQQRKNPCRNSAKNILNHKAKITVCKHRNLKNAFCRWSSNLTTP